MSNKHDAKVRKSTLVNFQIGLIASLLCVFVMFEMYTSVPAINTPFIDYGEVDTKEYSFDVFKEEKIPEKKEQVTVRPKKAKELDWTKLKEVADNTALKKLQEHLGSEMNQKTIPKGIPVDSIADIQIDEKIVYDISKVTVAPIYPGCEKYSNNEERIACFSSKIRKIVSKKFNAGLGAEYGLRGLQRIDVQFLVDKKGLINDVKVRAPHPALEKEARRVVGKFSKMEPGKIENKAVEVKYVLPIKFKVEN